MSCNYFALKKLRFSNIFSVFVLCYHGSDCPWQQSYFTLLLITSISIIVCNLKKIGEYVCGNPIHNFYFYRIGLKTPTIFITYEGMTLKFWRNNISTN